MTPPIAVAGLFQSVSGFAAALGGFAMESSEPLEFLELFRTLADGPNPAVTTAPEAVVQDISEDQTVPCEQIPEPLPQPALEEPAADTGKVQNQSPDCLVRTPAAPCKPPAPFHSGTGPNKSETRLFRFEPEFPKQAEQAAPHEAMSGPGTTAPEAVTEASKPGESPGPCREEREERETEDAGEAVVYISSAPGVPHLREPVAAKPRAEARPALPEPKPGQAAPATLRDAPGRAEPSRPESLAFTVTLTQAEPERRPEAAPARELARPAQAAPGAVLPAIEDIPAAARPVVRSFERSRIAAAEPVEAPAVRETATEARPRELRLAVDGGRGAPRLEVRVSEKGGSVRVAVHSPDPALRATVRSDLRQLVTRLEGAGYTAELRQPHGTENHHEQAAARAAEFRAESRASNESHRIDEPSRDTQPEPDRQGRKRNPEEYEFVPRPLRPRTRDRRFIDEFTR